MPDRKTHEYITKEILGKKCTPIHGKLDSLFSRYGARHRYMYHHKQGIKQVVNWVTSYNRMDYDIAIVSAYLHVTADFQINTVQFPIPNEWDYIGGEGDWPTSKPWKGQKDWSVKATDKELGIKDENIKKVKEDLKKLEEKYKDKI